MKKNLIISCIGLIVFVLAISSVCSICSSCTTSTPPSPDTIKSLNISVYLDLSDRLTRDLEPNQKYRDIAIVDYLVDYFKNQTRGTKILQSENKMKVFFYPTPKNSEISTIAEKLNVDIGEKKGVERTKALEEMQEDFQTNLAHIYEETLNEGNWIGCDIWGFFQQKKVDNLCVRPNARNIVVILTDGYIYDENNKIKDGNAYSYILPQTLEADGILIDNRKGELKGNGIEVLMLEVNSYKQEHRDKMIKVLEDWFASMGVEKFVVAETDANLTNTKTIIKNFLE